MTDRDWLLRDAMRLEDAQPDSHKGIWAAERQGPDGAEMCLVPAITAAGARARMEVLGLADAGDDLTLAGPVDRRAWQGLPHDEWFGDGVFDAWWQERGQE